MTIDLEAVDRELVGAQDGQRYRGQRRAGEAPVRSDADPAILLHLEGARSGVGTGYIRHRDRGDAVRSLLGHDGDVAEWSERGTAQQRLRGGRIDASLLDGEQIDGDAGNKQSIGRTALGEQIEVSRDKGGGTVELVVQR